MSSRIHTVAALAFQNEYVLLVKHGPAAQHITGVWGLPGGRLDEGESFLDAAAREFEEETGLTPEKKSMTQIVTIFEAEIPRKNGQILSTYWNVFVIREFDGVLLGTDETSPEWISITDVSTLNLLPNTENAIQEGLQLLKKTK